MPTITLRIEDDLNVRLDGMVDAMRASGESANRSSVIRMILQEHLDSDEAASLTRESLRRTHRLLRTTTTQAIAEISARLPELVQTAMADDDESEDA